MQQFGKLPYELIEEIKRLKKMAEKTAESYIGKTLIWKIDPSGFGKSKPFKGRRCVVRQASYEEDNGSITVLVKTESLKGGFVEDNDFVHRIYRELDTCFEIAPDSLQIKEAK